MSTSNKVQSKGKGNMGNVDNTSKNMKNKNKKEENKNTQAKKGKESNVNKQTKDDKKIDINHIEEDKKKESNKDKGIFQNNKDLINNTEKMDDIYNKNKPHNNPNLDYKMMGDTAHDNSNVKTSFETKNESKPNNSSYNNKASYDNENSNINDNLKGSKDQYNNSKSPGYYSSSGYPTSSGYYSSSGYPKSSGYYNSSGYPSSSGYYNSSGYPSSSEYYNSSKYPSSSGYYNSSGYPSSSGYHDYNNNYKEKIKGIYGFHNNKITNNCFMNSSLQSLLHCENFADRIHSIPDRNLLGKPLTKEIKNLMTQIYNGENELDPRKIKSILSEVEEKYQHNEQNDANEFITIFLNQLLKELNGISPNEYKTEKIPNDELEIKAFYKLEDKFFLKNKSFLLNLFYGRLERKYKCKNGHIVSIKFNNFNTLILPHPEESNDIVDLLKLYQKEKLINDTIFCNQCQKECQYGITTKIYNIPKHFIVCLEKESAYQSSGITFQKKLKTEEFMVNGYDNGKYYLNSFIEYSGNRKTGHYTAKVCQDKKWYSISDSYYHSIDESEIYNKSAIILFYTRADTD